MLKKDLIELNEQLNVKVQNLKIENDLLYGLLKRLDIKVDSHIKKMKSLKSFDDEIIKNFKFDIPKIKKQMLFGAIKYQIEKEKEK